MTVSTFNAMTLMTGLYLSSINTAP